MALYVGYQADNLLYAGDAAFHAAGDCYLDVHGIGYNLAKPQTIVPGVTGTRVGIFHSPVTGYTESEQTGDVNGAITGGFVTVSFSIVGTGVNGDPWFTGFRGQRFDVHGKANRVYNVLSLPSLQLNTRFVQVEQAMSAAEQLSVRQRQGKLITAMRAAATADSTPAIHSLPLTTAWSHAGLYMGETGVQLSGQRLRVQPGAYATGFASVTLDGEELPVSVAPIALVDGATITRPTSSVLHIATAEVEFQLRNSDHFLNIHSAQLDEQAVAGLDHIDGLLGQTADMAFTVDNSAAFRQHVEHNFELPAGQDDLWSTAFAHNQYKAAANAS